MANLTDIQQAIQKANLAGWLLYDFRGQNPIALHVARLESSGTRRWFLWIPAQGQPHWLIHAIEGNTFRQVSPDMIGTTEKYVSWQELSQKIGRMTHSSGDEGPSDGATRRIAMEYSPFGAIPYVSKVDAGIKEMVEEATGAEIVSSADLVQLVQAVLTPEQVTSHKQAAQICLDAKDLAFSFVRESLLAGHSISEYDVQSMLMEHFAKNQMDVDHPPIVAVNANAADPHYSPDANHHSPIQEGDMLLMDIFARQSNSRQDCFGDVTWTAFCGKEVPQKVQAVFRAVAASRDRAVSFIQEKLDNGEIVHGYEVDEASRQILSDAGYKEGILHRTGHSLGPAVHFNGVNIDNLETQDKRTLIPGVLFTVEPGIYLPELNFDNGPTAKGLGIRSEINCFMHADRVEVTTLPLQTELPALLA
ncbi:MAG: M24 family metallopeptidase [Chloroflexota bacterium]